MEKKKLAKLETIVIDLGGVLFSPKWREMGIASTSLILNVDERQFAKSIKKYQYEFYIGKFDENEFWRKVLKELNIENKRLISILMKRYRNYVTPNKTNFQILNGLKKKYKLISFNNTSKEWMEYRIAKFGLKRYFNAFITSGFTGYLKPTKESFDNLFLYCDPKTSLYIDDNLEYLTISKKYGIYSMLYKFPPDLKKLL